MDRDRGRRWSKFNRHMDRRLACFLHTACAIGDRTFFALPNEGGLYVWSKRAFGDFSGFMAAWTYWTSNLPYFPAVLYFAASNVLFMRQAQWSHLSANPHFTSHLRC